MITLDGNNLTIEDVARVAYQRDKVRIAPECIPQVKASRELVERLLEKGEVIYGITTGFGKLSDVTISSDQVENLQENLIRSHAAGVGETFPPEIVRAIMLLRANALVKGYSGIREKTVRLLVDMLNNQVHPQIYSQGSVGASGDLVPLAHMALVMIGRGEAELAGEVLPGRIALERAGLTPVRLQAKEGLALINGTQAMTAIAALLVNKAEHLLEHADLSASMSLEALKGIPHAFSPLLQEVRPHPGQKVVAENLLEYIEGSEIIYREGWGERVQDAYTLRCIPQIHGASRDAVAYVRKVVETEINSATDNPLIFPEQGQVISGGNFHGQPVAMAMDYLGIALSELASVAERRVERLVNPSLSGLAPFLARESGLNSGYMIAQYTAASLVSENKVYSSPSSVDSIPTSANQEDHVSMGTNAARHAWQIAANVKNVLAIEFLCAVQGIEFHSPLQPGRKVKGAMELIRSQVPTLIRDRELQPEIKLVASLIEEGSLLEAAGKRLAGHNLG
ncbi:MAG: histidine ammonia-lyase [Halanaerobium sp.]|nr:histidine ammonia-lyase [Halanaerobium sp.]